MPLVNPSIPNFVNGVSQQPATLRLLSQGAAQENCYSSVVFGLEKRSPTQHIEKLISGTLADAAIHMINRDSSERYVVVFLDNVAPRVFDLTGDEKTVATPDGTDYLNVTTPSTEIKCLTVQDHTFVLNTSKTVAMSASLSAAQVFEALLYVKQGNYAMRHAVYLWGDHLAADHTSHASDVTQIKTDVIAEELYDQLVLNVTTAWAQSTAYVEGDIRYANGNRYKCTAAGTSAGAGTGPSGTGSSITDSGVTWAFVTTYYAMTLTRVGSTIHLKASTANDFKIKVTDSNGDRNLTLAKGEIQDFSDLPNTAPNGFIVKVAGDTTTVRDDYYVKFTTSDTGETFARGLWKETIAPGMETSFDAATMPHLLVREGDGTFTFKKATWTDRLVGDDDSAPKPSFVGQEIKDVTFYRSRLGFLADENVIFSGASDFFRFWPTTVTAVLDDDPVDVSVAHTKASILRHAVAVSKKLYLFSDQSQFVLTGGDLLTPKTVGSDINTEFENSTRARPVVCGKNIYFVVEKGRFSGVREMFTDKNTDTDDAALISAHVPAYIPKNVFRMAAATNDDFIALLSLEERDAMYVYKFYWAGDDKLQSSWSKWTFGTGSKVLDAMFINADVYLLMQRQDGVYLEKGSVEEDRKDTGFDFEVLLDRRITDADCTVVYDEDVGTTWTLPYAESGTLEMCVRPGGSVPGGTKGTITRPSATTVRVVGKDWSAVPVYIGKAYSKRYTVSEPVLKQKGSTGGGEQVIAAGRLQVLRFTFLHSHTGYYRVEVTPRFGSTYQYPFTARLLASGENVIGAVSLESGEHRVPIRSKSDRVTIEIINDSFLPSRIQSAEYEAMLVLRAQRT